MTTRLALKIAATGLLVLCGTLPVGAEIFVYVSNANDRTIATFRMLEGVALEPGATVEVVDLVMPLAISPDRTILYAGVRSVPFGVHSYAIDQTTGALSRLGSAPLLDNMLYLSTDRRGKIPFLGLEQRRSGGGERAWSRWFGFGGADSGTEDR